MKNKVKLNKQYGLVNKNVLQNKNISIKAKGLYTYLCARAGNKGYCNPTVATICNDLNINDATFHKYKNELLNNNIITITKQGTGIKQRNTYQLPKATTGYGIVYLETLKDNNINLQAKAIYGLLACYSGTRFIAFPLSKLIYTYLKISRNTYFRILKLLKVHNIVTTKQLHINGRFAYCNYYINGAKPNKATTKYIFKFTGKRKNITNTTNSNITPHIIQYDNFKDLVHTNINYLALLGYFKHNNKAIELLNDITDIITNTLFTKPKPLIFNNITLQSSIVQAIFNKLEFKHVKYVINNILNVKHKINNRTQYIKVCLTNAYYNFN